MTTTTLARDAVRPLAEWHEDDGPVVWWKFPVNEPAWIGTPLDDDWPGYHTHWTPHPAAPKGAEPREQGRARLTADVVEQRLLTWRQRFVNRSGDQLALDDFMDQRSIDDLVDFVCDEDTPPDVLGALRWLVAAIIVDGDGDDDDENAPGHAHEVPGVWDDDNNPSIAGLPCELCAAWRNARAVLSAHDEKEPR